MKFYEGYWLYPIFDLLDGDSWYYAGWGKCPSGDCDRMRGAIYYHCALLYVRSTPLEAAYATAFWASASVAYVAHTP